MKNTVRPSGAIPRVVSILFSDAQTAQDDRRISSQVLRQLQHRFDSHGDVSAGSSVALVPSRLSTGGSGMARYGNSEEAGVIQAAPDAKQLDSGHGQGRGRKGNYWETNVAPIVQSGA